MEINEELIKLLLVKLVDVETEIATFKKIYEINFKDYTNPAQLELLNKFKKEFAEQYDALRIINIDKVEKEFGVKGLH